MRSTTLTARPQGGIRIVLITQNDVFYLPEMIEYFIRSLQPYDRVVGCVLMSASPFGKTESLHLKAMRTWRIFGTAFFLRHSVKYLAAKLLGRDVARVLRRHQIDLIQNTEDINSERALNRISEYEPDVLISLAANQLFKKQLITLPPLGTLNLHSALLPKYRGLMPTFWVLKNGEKETGVSVFFVDKGIDSGPVLVQKRVDIGQRSQAELIRATKKLGVDALVEAMELLRSGQYELSPNEDSQATYCSFPDRHDVREFLAGGNRFY